MHLNFDLVMIIYKICFLQRGGLIEGYADCNVQSEWFALAVEKKKKRLFSL